MPRVLLLLPSATYRAPDFLDAARAVGAEVVVGSDRRQALAATMGDRALTLPLRRPEAAADAIIEHHKRTPLDAVVAVDDQGVLAAAMAGERLGLPHNPPAAVAATRDKAAMRERLAAAGVAQPTFRIITDDSDIEAAAQAVGLPCVVKPVPLSASRGVIRADTPAEAATVARRIRRILADAGEDTAGPLVIEELIRGPEVAVEGLLRGGRLELLAIFDKPDQGDGPYFEETLLVTPSRLPTATQRQIERTTAMAAGALGLVEGPIHAELRVPDQTPVLLEIAARSIGGLCSRTLRFGLGTSLEEVILRHALSLPTRDLTRAGAASGVLMLPIPTEGTLEEVRGQDDARAVPGIEGLEITVARGRPVRPLPEGDRYLGFIFARGSSPERVEAALRAAHEALDVVISPEG